MAREYKANIKIESKPTKDNPYHKVVKVYMEKGTWYIVPSFLKWYPKDSNSDEVLTSDEEVPFE